MSLLELVIAMTLMSTGMLVFSQTMIESVASNTVSHEAAVASQWGRRAMETIEAAPFDQAFILFNSDEGDDPGPEALGAFFQVPGLTPSPADPDGNVGTVEFPTALGDAGELQLREDVVDPGLGMPRDLNGDGLIDNLDHRNDYLILPVRVRFNWRGVVGQSSFEVKTIMIGF
jgi:hypothetical protein